MLNHNSKSGAFATTSSVNDVSNIFKRTEIIGRGKFGVVYKGYHAQSKQIYAIKVLNLDSDEDEVEDVQREIQFLSSLKQIPNVTKYYGSYLRDTSLWIIMEYCAGGSLRSLLRPGRLDEKYIGIVMRELLVALKFIHKDNIIHRDIKAANVLITNEGNVKLCDFGVAAQLNQSGKRRQTMAGTPYWMAPEVIMEGVYYDTKVDIWSLGITCYEIATGNPPYCEVEALRAMQMITKSKPARLESRSYSTLLKEFIALCLDESSSERPSADELLKSKFIKAYKSTSTTILKELITRYLLFRDKSKNARESTAGDDQLSNSNSRDESNNSAISEPDVKWDFDSLDSKNYIIENNINVEAIPEEPATPWSSGVPEQFNYAYPDEDQYYNYTTATNIFSQATTIGKQATNQNGTAQNNTINAPMTNTANYFSRPVINTEKTSGTVPHGTNGLNSSKKLESKAPKQLLELFEDDLDNDSLQRENDTVNNLSASLEPIRITDDMGGDKNSLSKTQPPFLANNSYYSQSSPALPMLQTKFNKPVMGALSSVTTGSPSVEIEIPEELPTKSTLMISNQDKMDTQTKPRSSTMTGSMAGKPPPTVNRRLTLNNSTTPFNSNNPQNFPFVNDGNKPNKSEPGTDNITNNSMLGSLSQTDTHQNDEQTAGYTTNANVKHRKTPSPSKIILANASSPNKKTSLASSSNSMPSSINTSTSKQYPSNVSITPSMTPIAINSENNKNALLKPLNTTDISHRNHQGISMTSAVEKPNSMNRANTEFRKINPNLKLQMPLPTNALKNKLLDNGVNTQNVNTPLSNNENINQFGFNPNAVSNLPVSMTPINEKATDFSSANLKRSHSMTARKISNVSDTNPVQLQGNATDNSISNVGASGVQKISNTPVIQGINPPNNNVAGTTNQSPVTHLNISKASQLINSHTPSPGLPGSGPNANSVGKLLMHHPPMNLNMNVFQDMEFTEDGDYIVVDKKPQMLEMLDELLGMYEESLPAIEEALKAQLPAHSTPDTVLEEPKT